MAAPRRDRTQRESPAFAQNSLLSLVTSSVTAVHPERSFAWSGSARAHAPTDPPTTHTHMAALIRSLSNGPARGGRLRYVSSRTPSQVLVNAEKGVPQGLRVVAARKLDIGQDTVVRVPPSILRNRLSCVWNTRTRNREKEEAEGPMNACGTRTTAQPRVDGTAMAVKDREEADVLVAVDLDLGRVRVFHACKTLRAQTDKTGGVCVRACRYGSSSHCRSCLSPSPRPLRPTPGPLSRVVAPPRRFQPRGY